MIRQCEGCMYWSEMVAGSDGGGPLKALCLQQGAPDYNRMTYLGCPFKEEGDPIDFREPPEWRTEDNADE